MNASSGKEGILTIALVSDFFYPNVGGIENHIYQLAQCLLLRGHRVIVVTHSYGRRWQRQGVRYLARGLKVYYIPFRPFYNQCVFVTLFGLLPVLRDIFIREDVDIVHGHSVFSTFAGEAMMHSKALGLPSVFTDHSLFGFADLSSIFSNKSVYLLLNAVDDFICVSNVAKENLVLRGYMRPDQVFVIPNAIDSMKFKPDPSARDPNMITVVVMSRLVYRKGADLLAVIIPPLCFAFENVKFIIGGDGEKRIVLEEMCERHNLHSRVQLLGTVPNDKVREVLVRGDIFLNTSLTESFCIAIVEAASCGLVVVSTAVGGVPEVLPANLLRLAPVSASGLVSTLAETIDEIKQKRIYEALETNNQAASNSSLSDASTHKFSESPIASDESKIFWQRHEEVHNFYTWQDIAERTEKVYLTAMSSSHGSAKDGIKLALRKLGPISGKILAIIWFIEWTLIYLMEWIRPYEKIERVPFFYAISKPENNSEISKEHKNVSTENQVPHNLQS